MIYLNTYHKNEVEKKYDVFSKFYYKRLHDEKTAGNLFIPEVQKTTELRFRLFNLDR